MTEAGHGAGLGVGSSHPDRVGLVEFAVGVKCQRRRAFASTSSRCLRRYTALQPKHNFHVQNWNGRPTIDETLYPLPLRAAARSSTTGATRRSTSFSTTGARKAISRRRSTWCSASGGPRAAGDSAKSLHHGAQQADELRIPRSLVDVRRVAFWDRPRRASLEGVADVARGLRRPPAAVLAARPAAGVDRHLRGGTSAA